MNLMIWLPESWCPIMENNSSRMSNVPPPQSACIAFDLIAEQLSWQMYGCTLYDPNTSIQLCITIVFSFLHTNAFFLLLSEVKDL